MYLPGPACSACPTGTACSASNTGLCSTYPGYTSIPDTALPVINNTIEDSLQEHIECEPPQRNQTHLVYPV